MTSTDRLGDKFSPFQGSSCPPASWPQAVILCVLRIQKAGLGPSSFIRYGHIVRRFAPTLCQGLRIHSTAHFSQSGAVISGTGSEISISMTIFAWHRNMNFATCAVLMYDVWVPPSGGCAAKRGKGRWTGGHEFDKRV